MIFPEVRRNAHFLFRCLSISLAVTPVRWSVSQSVVCRPGHLQISTVPALLDRHRASMGMDHRTSYIFRRLCEFILSLQNSIFPILYISCIAHFLMKPFVTWRWCLNISSFMMAKTAENLHLADRWYLWYFGTKNPFNENIFAETWGNTTKGTLLLLFQITLLSDSKP